MKSHPNIREIIVWIDLVSINDLQIVTDSRFPALEVLVIDLGYSIHNRIQYLHGHKNLTHIAFSRFIPSLEHIRNLKKDKFPRLGTIGLIEIDDSDRDEYPELVDFLQQQDFEICEDKEKLSLMPCQV